MSASLSTDPTEALKGRCLTDTGAVPDREQTPEEPTEPEIESRNYYDMMDQNFKTFQFTQPDNRMDPGQYQDNTFLALGPPTPVVGLRKEEEMQQRKQAFNGQGSDE